MLHVHDSSDRVRLLVTLLLMLFGATGRAYAQSQPAPPDLLREAGAARTEARPVSPVANAVSTNTTPCDKPNGGGHCQPTPADTGPKAGGTDTAAKQTQIVRAPKQMQSLTATLQFSAASFSVPEGGGSAVVTVTRAGSADSAVSVEYRVSGNTASQTSDFTYAAGKLSFASGETSKTFSVLITDDSYVEGTEAAEISLNNVTGDATLGNPSTASLLVFDDAIEPAKNPNSEAKPFVTQHYNDFLDRAPDAPGLTFWTDQINSCGTDQQCHEIKRVNVSAAFYLSIEFQQTGFFVYRMHKAAFGNLPDEPVPVRVQDFLRDTQSAAKEVVVGHSDWQKHLESNQDAFALDFVQRAEFRSRYPAVTSPTAFVNSLDMHTGGLLSSDKKSALIRELSPNPTDARLRASVLTQVVTDPQFTKAEFNRAFVLMQYFGYLRRNPDDAPEANRNFDGYNFWLNKLDQFNGNFVRADMVKAFINSDEYRRRFGPLDGANQRPAVDAGAEQTVTLPNKASLSASVSDDMLPEGRTLILSWNKVSGPDPVSFADTGAAATTATFSEVGTSSCV